MLSNYPPGVTGLEPEIAGADERTIAFEHECPDCGAITDDDYTPVLIWNHYSAEIVPECPQCGYVDSIEVDPRELFARD